MRKRHLPAQTSSGSLSTWPGLGGTTAAACPPAGYGNLHFGVREGWWVSFSGKVYMFVPLAKLGWGWGLISASVLRGKASVICVLQDLCICSFGRHACICSLGQGSLCDCPCKRREYLPTPPPPVGVVSLCNPGFLSGQGHLSILIVPQLPRLRSRAPRLGWVRTLSL